MTMLDSDAAAPGWLKWSLAAPHHFRSPSSSCPTTTSPRPGSSPDTVLADVEGQTVTVAEFQRRYNAQLQQYRNAYGGQISEQMLRQLGIDQQILQSLVDEQAMVAEARQPEPRGERRRGAPAHPVAAGLHGERHVHRRDALPPAALEQNPPLTTREFEDQLRQAILAEKLRTSVTGWMSVSDADVAAGVPAAQREGEARAGAAHGRRASAAR